MVSASSKLAKAAPSVSKHLRITFTLPGESATPVGGYKVVYEYASALAERGHSVSVAHPRSLFRPGNKENLLQATVHTARLLARLLFRGFNISDTKVCWLDIHPAVKLISIPTLSSVFIPNADIVVATHWRTAEYAANYSASKGIRFYLIQHYESWAGPEERVRATWKAPLKKIVIARWLEKIGKDLGEKEFYYVPNAIDHNSFYLTKPIESRPQRIAMLYSSQNWKGAADGIAALIKVREFFPDIQACFFGTNERGSEIPNWITYIRDPSREILRDSVYNSSAIYLCPSWSEGWGLPTTEAMACGCAVVSTDNGGVHDFVTNWQSGLIVAPRSPDSLADAIIELLLDDSLRKSLAMNGMAGVAQFNYERSATEIESIFVKASTNNII